MKRVKGPRRGSRAYLRRFGLFIIERIEKALDFGDETAIRNAIVIGRLEFGDRRKRKAAELSRRRQVKTAAVVLPVAVRLSNRFRKRITPAELANGCADEGHAIDTRTAQAWLRKLGIEKPAKVGRKPKK
jgi:hypothetical protein